MKTVVYIESEGYVARVETERDPGGAVLSVRLSFLRETDHVNLDSRDVAKLTAAVCTPDPPGNA